MVVDKKQLEALTNERIRLVSKKLVEGINKREQERLNQVIAELAASKPLALLDLESTL